MVLAEIKIKEKLKRLLMSNDSSFCILPWTGLHVFHTGHIAPCCRVRLPDLDPLFLKKATLLEQWNAPWLKELRLNILQGKKSSVCTECYQREASKERSFRQEHNHYFKSSFSLVHQTQADGSFNKMPICHLIFSPSSLCPLQCRMCIYRGLAVPPSESSVKNQSIESHRVEEVLSLLEKGPIERISFGGGEPFILPASFKVIETLKRLKHFDSVLIYNTSLCTLEYQDRSVLEDLRDFNNLIFYVSIDGIKEHFNYIREGHDWNLLEKNLETLREQLSHAQIKIAITVSLYNVFWLPEIIDELLKKAQPNQFIFNLVYTPQVFNPMILTTEDKVFIKNKYYRYIKNLLLRMDYIDAVFLTR